MKTFFAVILVLIIAGGLFYYFKTKNTEDFSKIAQASYYCKNNKKIDATFFKGEPKPVKQGEMPIPTGKVELKLSDGRDLILPQTISASGIRYANNDESLIFWNEGNGAFILENNVQTFMSCIAVVPDPGNLPQIYSDATEGFSIHYPASYTNNTSYQYTNLGPGKEIDGIQFTIPAEMASGTNLAPDTYISIEKIPNTQNCDAKLFLDQQVPSSTNITDNNIEYSIASTIGAAAGNIYEEKIWAFPGTNPCIAVRYFIHSGNIGNYPPGMVQEFNHETLIKQFDQIRKTLTLL